MNLTKFFEKYNIREGSKIEFFFKEQKITGTIIPTNNEKLKIKFDSGYNAGFDLKEIKNLKKIGESKKVGKTKKIEIKNNPNLPTISLLHTGGTIASRVDYRTGGVYASFEAEDVATMFPEILKKTNINSILVSNMMSEDMTLKDYSKIVKAVEKEINNKKIKGIIIGHGTDTLGYSAAYLSFAIKNSPIPIVLVGSQRSSDRGSSDAGMNLICATEFITKTNYTGVFICMHNSMNDDCCAILPATKTRKMHSSRRDAFKAINDTPIAIIDYKTKIIKKIKPEKKQENLIIKNNFSEKVGLIKIYPGIDEKILEHYRKEKYNGLIIEGTGLGHTPIGTKETFLKKIKTLINSGCIIGITTQCINGRVNNTVYTNLRKLSKIGVIFCEDMISETAFIKLSWLLGNYSKEKTKKLLSKNLRGEITDFSRIDCYEY